MKTIVIRDGIGHCRAEYQLRGSVLEMVESGGCRDALNENGCEVSEEMGEDDIASAVYESWAGDGYDGDPEENGLTVRVNTGG